MSKQRDAQQRKEAARHEQYRKILFNKTAVPKMLYLMKYSVHQLKEMKININEDIKVFITDLLSKDSIQETKIFALQGDAGKEIIKQIVCPHCNKIITLHKHWGCFICDNPQHDKKVFDIRYLKCEKVEFYERRIQELEGITLRIEFDSNRRGPYVPKVQTVML